MGDPNYLDLGDHGGIPWRYDIPRHFLDHAVARTLNRDDDDTHDCD